MIDPAGRILLALQQAAGLYHRLVLIVAPDGESEGEALREVAERSGTRPINVSLELGRQLLELPRKQRPQQAHAALEELVSAARAEIVLLQHLELLFEPSLAQDPLRLLEQLSRGRTVVAAWPGRLEGENLVYAEPAHPEHRRYPLRAVQALILELRDDVATQAGSR